MKINLLTFALVILSSLQLSAAAPLSVKGMGVYFDGRGIRSNAISFEYSKH